MALRRQQPECNLLVHGWEINSCRRVAAVDFVVVVAVATAAVVTAVVVVVVHCRPCSHPAVHPHADVYDWRRVCCNAYPLLSHHLTLGARLQSGRPDAGDATIFGGGGVPVNARYAQPLNPPPPPLQPCFRSFVLANQSSPSPLALPRTHARTHARTRTHTSRAALTGETPSCPEISLHQTTVARVLPLRHHQRVPWPLARILFQAQARRVWALPNGPSRQRSKPSTQTSSRRATLSMDSFRVRLQNLFWKSHGCLTTR
jgi:hypothetical protein